MKKIRHTMILLIPLCIILSMMPAAAIADRGSDTGGEYEEWQTESDNYKEDDVSIKIVIKGLDSVEIRIAETDEWIRVSDGGSVKAVRSNYIEIKGVEGMWMSAAYGETKSEAEKSPAATVSDEKGGNTSVGVDNNGYIVIRAASTQNEAEADAAVGTEDAGGNVTWSEVSNDQAEAGAGKSTSVYRAGQTFYGKATAIARVGRQSGSTITFRHDTGWIKNETKVKTITAVCISGQNRGLSYVGAVFNYVATIKEVRGNSIKTEVVYYPRKNKPNSGPGEGSLPKAQIMAKTLWLEQYPHTGYVKLLKKPSPSDTDYLKECPNNYTLEAAKYYLYTDSGCTGRAKDTDGREIILTTGKDGNTNTVEVELGGSSRTFWAKEIAASRGYKKDPAVLSVTVSTDNTESSPAVIQSAEPPSAGIPEVTVYKLDPTGKYGWSKLRGAEYRISYYDVLSKEDISAAQAKRSWVFTTRKVNGNTDKDGYHAGFDLNEDEAAAGSDAFYTENDKRVIPCGWFTIQEIKAPAGLALDDTVTYGRVFQPENGSRAEVKIEGAQNGAAGGIDVTVNDAPQAVRLIIDKTDASTGENMARESETEHSSTRLGRFASLAGAEYEVYYDDNDLASPELVGKIVTDENGRGELDARTMGDERFIGDRLAVGDYIIKEVKSSPGFVTDKYYLSGDTQKIRDDEKIEVICGYDSEGKTLTKTIGGKFSEGGHIFRTRAETGDTNIFSYTVSSAEQPVRTYIRKTDAATGREIKGAELQIISDNDEDRGLIVEQWTSSGKEHLVWELPAGKYILREITAPYGYDIAEDVSFEIKDGVIINRVEMKNKPVIIKTSASDALTDTHHGVASEEQYVKDKVKISGLYEDRSYMVKGRLIDKKTGETLKDKDGNEVGCEREFIAAGDKVEVEMSFVVDSRMLEGENAAVGFERLYRTSPVHENSEDAAEDNAENSSLPVEIAKHEDADFEGQTIRYGGIMRTTALDKKGKSHNVTAGPKTVIRDFVEYNNLSPAETYKIEGELYDKTEGKLTGITSSVEFRPEAADGKIEVGFRFDAGAYRDHTFVVFETLTLNGRLIDEHKDPEDKDQTVYIKPRKSPKTGDHAALYLYAISMTLSLAGILVMRRCRMR